MKTAAFLPRSLLLVSLHGLAACAANVPLADPAAPLSEPTSLCFTEPAEVPCRDPLTVEAWLRGAPFSILGVAETQGSSGAKLLTLRLSPPKRPHVTLRAKWRPYGESLFNDARKEIAAHAVQKVAFEPHEYVVPPTVGRCIPLQTYHRTLVKDTVSTFEGTSCVYGSLSYWLEEVEKSPPYTQERFQADPEYRRSIADLNLFTFLIQHGDTHDANFLQKKTRGATRLYSPDNAIAFNPLLRNPLDLVSDNWYQLRVPALREDVVNRLRQITRRDLNWLAIVEQYEVRNGMLISTGRTTRLPGDEPVRRVGSVLQLGLSEAEINRLYEHIELTLSRVANGEIALF